MVIPERIIFPPIYDDDEACLPLVPWLASIVNESNPNTYTNSRAKQKTHSRESASWNPIKNNHITSHQVNIKFNLLCDNEPKKHYSLDAHVFIAGLAPWAAVQPSAHVGEEPPSSLSFRRRLEEESGRDLLRQSVGYTDGTDRDGYEQMPHHSEMSYLSVNKEILYMQYLVSSLRLIGAATTSAAILVSHNMHIAPNKLIIFPPSYNVEKNCDDKDWNMQWWVISFFLKIKASIKQKHYFNMKVPLALTSNIVK